MYKNRKSVYHVSVVFFSAFLFATACSDDPVPDDLEIKGKKDKAVYELFVAGKELIGDGVNSNWDPSLGIVWLGTDEKNLPTGTLTILIDSIAEDAENGTIAYINSATLSTVDQLVGTGAEINGKLYHTLDGDELLGLTDLRFLWFDNVEIGENYIEGRIGIYDEFGDIAGGWPMREATTGELIMLIGSFTSLVSGTGN